MTATLTPADVRATSRRPHIVEGVRDITPMVVGVIPFALAIGASVGTSSLSTAQGIFSAPAILAGAAQLSTIEMLERDAAPLVIILSAVMINARILLYSTALAPWFRRESLRRRLLLAIPIIDQMYFTCIPRFERGDLDRRGRQAYYVGAAAWLVSAFLVTQTLSIVAGARLPDALGLRIAAPLALAGLLARSTSERRSMIAAVIGAIVVVFGGGLPFQSTVLVASVAGMAVGTMASTNRSAAT